MEQNIILSPGLAVSLLDLVALGWFCCCWFGYTFYAEYMRDHSDNLLQIMNQYRLRWMQQMLKRGNRMADETAIGNLLRSIAFFASTSILILAGLVSLLGQQEQVTSVVQTLPYSTSSSVLLWEVKVLLLALIFIYGFFKFTWSLRQYNYAAIFVVAAPLEHEHQDYHDDIARSGARLLANAARHFNMGLRAYYYGLAALAWFIHPGLFMLTSVIVVLIMYRREFHSRALDYISNIPQE